jgi:hypothetical protein
MFWQITAVIAVLFTLWHIFGNKKISIEGKAIFITGCDTGFGICLSICLFVKGRLATEYFAAKGIFVYAGCLTEKAIKELNSVQNVQALHLDVTKESSIAACYDVIAKESRKRILIL